MASPSAVAASGPSSLEDHLALDIPEALSIYEEITQGPQQKSSANQRAMSKDLIWMHITKEEYDHLPGVLEHHPEDLEGHLGAKKIIEIPSNLRHPWRHISLNQHPLQAHHFDILADIRGPALHGISGAVTSDLLQAIYLEPGISFQRRAHQQLEPSWSGKPSPGDSSGLHFASG